MLRTASADTHLRFCLRVRHIRSPNGTSPNPACLRSCTNSKRKFGSIKYIPNSQLYKKSNIKRIDNQQVAHTIKLFEIPLNECQILKSCLELDAVMLNNDRHSQTQYKPPWYLMHMYNQNAVYNNVKMALQ